MRIAISGKSGCGNTTVSTLVAERLGYALINFTFRNMAKEREMDFWEFCKLAEQDDSIDRELDRRQVEMALAHEHCVLGSRLAIWMLKEADLKVYLTATDEERAQRILRREGGSFSERLAQTKSRDRNDTARYMRIYGIDNTDPAVADMVIDTEGLSPEQIASLIIDRVKAH
ncbi:MAG: AAA family ATPase [Sphaerochaetaceae bacterium]|jgi:cytidylate kinase|nr:AAA family ATPase [Sphaerochaetaceae bacterium]MDD3941122.1 AAA family ATPase [Sphaerochaetaceae bacterium]MDX9938471.1 AAA family ATPase [Sphaerochaetaceae bacterium]